jgi:hypothetical protein
MLRSIRPTRARRPSDASVDPTEARNTTLPETRPWGIGVGHSPSRGDLGKGPINETHKAEFFRRSARKTNPRRIPETTVATAPGDARNATRQERGDLTKVCDKEGIPTKPAPKALRPMTWLQSSGY